MATLKEIADQAKVSIGTVDRVIHRRGRVATETSRRIQKIIRDLDYKPNILARSLSSSKSYLFGVLLPLPEQDGFYWELPLTGIKKAQEELEIYKVKINYFYYDKYSETSLKKAFLSAIQHSPQPDGLLIAPVLSQAMEKLIHQIPEKLPYIFLDSYIPNSKCSAYIGEDSFQSGLLSAKLMNMLVKGSGTVAVMDVLPFDYHIQDRIQGFQSYFAQNGKIILTMCQVDARKPQSFVEAAKKVIQDHQNLVGIFIPTACSFYIAEAMMSHGSNHKVFIIGYDLVKQNVACLQKGMIDFLISQRSEMQGYTSIYKLYKKVVLKESIESQVLMPLDIITQENLKYYQN